MNSNTFVYILVLLLVCLVWFGFYGISNIVGYLIPNPVLTSILNIWFVNRFYRYPQLNDQKVLFLRIQLIISQQN